MVKMRKYAVVIVREETRVVWAAGCESAQDIALGLDAAQLRDENEETTDVYVCDAPDNAQTLNTPEGLNENPPEGWEECRCCGCWHPGDGKAYECRDDAHRWPFATSMDREILGDDCADPAESACGPEPEPTDD